MERLLYAKPLSLVLSSWSHRLSVPGVTCVAVIIINYYHLVPRAEAHCFLTVTQGWWCYYYPHFTGEETEAQSG